jgi:hypothetical protein
VEEWRVRAVDSFPEVCAELREEDEDFSVYQLWFELLSLVEHAHRSNDEQLLGRIYGYASWTFDQDRELSNAVSVAFYEHILDERWMRFDALPWLNRRVVKDIRTLWVDRLTADELREVDQLVETLRLHP